MLQRQHIVPPPHPNTSPPCGLGTTRVVLGKVVVMWLATPPWSSVKDGVVVVVKAAGPGRTMQRGWPIVGVTPSVIESSPATVLSDNGVTACCPGRQYDEASIVAPTNILDSSTSTSLD